ALTRSYRHAGERVARPCTQFVYHPGWGVGRDKNSSKRARLIALDAELIQGRHSGQQRRALEMAKALMRPSLIWPIDAVSWSIIDSTWLPIRSVRAGPLPLYGTCSSFRLACRISS